MSNIVEESFFVTIGAIIALIIACFGFWVNEMYIRKVAKTSEYAELLNDLSQRVDRLEQNALDEHEERTSAGYQALQGTYYFTEDGFINCSLEVHGE